MKNSKSLPGQIQFYPSVQIIKILDLRILPNSRAQVLLNQDDQIEIASIDFKNNKIETRELRPLTGVALFTKIKNQYVQSYQNTSEFQVYEINEQLTQQQKISFSEAQKQSPRFLSHRVLTSTPPYFSPTLSDQTIQLGGTLLYNFPATYQDYYTSSGSYSSTSTGISSLISVSYTTTRSFITFNNSPYPGSISINPGLTVFGLVGSHKIGITLTSPEGSLQYFMNVIVTNSAPIFSASDLPLTSITLYAGQTQTSKLPTPTDSEGHTVTIACTPPKSFITFQSVGTFTFSPTSQDIGTYTVTVTLSDGNLQTLYSFQVDVPSRPPAFDDSTTSFPDLTITLNSNDKFPVSTFTDPDGETVKITLEAVSGSVPTWVKLQTSNTEVYAAPDMSTVVGTYNLKLVLKTTHDTVSFPFQITVTNSAPYLISGPPNPSQYTVNINTPQTIDFTSEVKDNENHPITLLANANFGGTITSIPGGIFTQPSSYSIVVSPTSIAHLGTYTVSFTLSDGNLQTSYSFQVDVPNRLPVFDDSTTSFPDLTIKLGSNDKFTVPTFSDPDGETVAISIQEASNGIVPTWVQLQSSNKLLNAAPPLNAITVVGTYNLKIVLKSSQYASFPFQITTINTAPYLKTTPTPSYQIILNQVQIVDFTSQVYDDESHPITLKAYFTPSGGTQTLIPSGIFTQPSAYKITVSPTAIADIKTYSISFTLSDSNMQTSYTFQVDVKSRVPAFSGGFTSFSDLTIALNSKGTQTIPSSSDPDGEAVSISLQDSAGGTFPSWAYLKNSNALMEAAPVAFSDVGPHIMKIGMKTAHDFVTFPFLITVTNSAPYFTSPPPTGYMVDITFPQTIDLTNIVKDNENHQIFLKAYYTFQGVKYTIPNGIFTQPAAFKIKIYPTQFAHLGSYTLDYEIYDGQPLKSTASTTLTVINFSPTFVDKTPASFTMRFNHTYNYVLPPYNDIESNPVTVSLKAYPSGLIMSFAKIQPGQKVITFKPNQWTQLHNYDVYLTLSDTDESNTYQFQMTITNSAPRFSNEKPSKQRAQLNKVTWYYLPQSIDDEYNPIFVHQHPPIPKFVKYEDGKYIFSPTDPATELGIFDVFFELSDTQLATPYSFKLEIYNNPPYFKKPLIDQSFELYKSSIYTLPESEDAEGLSYKISTLNPLPDFIKLENDQFKIHPQQKSELGQHRIKVCLTDSYAASMCKGLIITVFDPSQIQKSETIKPVVLPQKFKNNTKKQTKVPSNFLVTMYIQSATRDGRISVKFNSPMAEDIPKLIENIDENSLRVQIRTQGNKHVSFNITQKIALTGFIEIKLKFSDPAKISNQIEPDVIQVIAQEDMSVTGLKYTILLKKDSVATKVLPPQISLEMKGMADTFVGGRIIISKSLAVNFAFSMGLQYIWNCLDDFSFLTINSMISMPVPGIVQLIQKVLLNFIYLDLLLTDMWLPYVFQTTNEQAQASGGINEFFEENGFGTKTLIVNLGSSFVYLAVFVALFIIYFNVYLLSKVITSLNRVKERLEDILFWKYTLRLFFSQFPPVLMSSLINMNDLKFTALIDKVSTILGLFFVCSLPAGLIAVFYLINRFTTIENPRLDELIQEDTRGNWVGRNWKSLNLLRWTVTLITMVFMRSHFEIQIMILIQISLLFQVIMIQWRPLLSPGDHWITLFNEVMTSAYLYILMILTDFFGENSLRDQCGKTLVIMLAVVVSVNLLRVFYKVGSYLRKKYIEWRARRQTLLKLLGEAKTVAIKPSVNNREVQLDMTTMTNHSADLFSRQPFDSFILDPKENPNKKHIFGKSTIEEEFKIEFDERPPMQSKQKKIQEDPFKEKRTFINQALDY